MKVLKEKRFGKIGRLSLFTALLLMVLSLFQQTTLTTYAQGSAKVTVSSGKIRETANKDSEVIASVKSGDKLDIIAQTTDSEGYTWYKVYVDGTSTGYIRADLVGEVTGNVDKEKTSDSNNSDSSKKDEEKKEEESSKQPEIQYVQVKDTDVTAAKVTGGSVNVRENPSTSANVAGKASAGVEVTISGESTDTEGKVWYQVSFDNIKGFIRSDFLEIIEEESEEEESTEEIPEETVEETVEAVVEEPIEEPVNEDYELVYEANAEGIEEWFLYDYNRGTKQGIEDLLASVRQNQEEEQGAASQLKTFKILAIVMAAVILALIVAVTILIFKLRDSYEYVYEDDDDEEDNEDDEDDEDDEEDDDDYMVSGAKEKKSLFQKPSAPIRLSESTAERPQVERAPEVPATPVRLTEPEVKREPEKKNDSWQSKDFLDIDDDMEFEFLDLK